MESISPSEQQLLESARQRVSTMLSVADAIGGEVDLALVRGAALVPLSPIAERSAVLMAQLIMANSEGVAVVLAGLADDKVLAKLLALMDLDPHSIP
jgi:hypothetical protein